jgi:hypothetical protein
MSGQQWFWLGLLAAFIGTLTLLQAISNMVSQKPWSLWGGLTAFLVVVTLFGHAALQ